MEILNELLPYAKGYLMFYGVISIISLIFVLTIFYKTFKSIFKDLK